jgi:hypothetical protein
MARDVFISNSDRAVAEAVRAAIEREGLFCRASGEEVGGARILLLILSGAGADSPEIAAEAARGAGRPAILFRIEEVVPSAVLAAALGGAQCLDALPPPIEPHLDYLGAIIGRLLEAAMPD